MNPILRVTLLCSLCMIMLGCSKQQTSSAPSPSSGAPQPSSSAPASVPAAASAAPATSLSSGTVLASAQFSNDPNLRCDLLEVRRTSGGALLIRWRLINTTSAPQSSGLAAGTQAKPIYYDFSWEQLYYTDPAENKKYAFLTDSENNRILDVFWGNLEPGQQRLNWAKFPAPPPSSTKITVVIPKFMPFEDVPVS